MFIRTCIFSFVKYICSCNCRLNGVAGLKSLICFSLLTLSLTGQCQWKVFHYESRKANVMPLNPLKAQLKDGYAFFGTSENFDENVITKGYEPFLQDTLWKIELNKPLSSFLRYLYFNLYTVNVSAFNLHVCEKNGNCYENRFKFSKDGYQVPFEWVIDERTKVLNNSIQHDAKHHANSNPVFLATIELKDRAGKYQFVVGDAKAYEQSFIKEQSRGFLFHELTGKKENQVKSIVRKKFGNSYPLEQNTEFSTYTGSAFNFELEKADSLSQQKSTLTLIRYFFQKYPFYKEHALDEAKTLAAIDQIISDSLLFGDKIERLKEIANGLHDGHFYFQKEDKKKLNASSPLILKRINDKVQVVGIRDQRLESKIELGDQIRTIEDKVCEKFIDSLSDNYFGNLTQRKDLAISHLFEKTIDSSSYEVTLEKPDGSRYKVALKYDRRFPIPKKFVPEHFGFRRLEHRWSYLKINKWDKGDWIKFYNLKDSIQNANGIILDLRGNPGGFEIETIKIASCFLQRPFEYSTQTYTTLNKTYSGKTIVKPSSFLDLSRLKVIVLVDNKTACASESFALMLKKVNGATIIGTSRTSSSFSTVHSFQLPENINLFANVLSKTYMLSENKTLEYEGIEPDILVNLDRYSDLYGYEDKVLNTAFKMIDRSTK